MPKIITMFELQRLPQNELAALQRKIHVELIQSAPGSAERRNALATLENIRRAFQHRVAFRPPTL